MDNFNHPFTVPASVKLNDREQATLNALMNTAASNGYDFGFSEWSECEGNLEGTGVTAKNFNSYVAHLSRKGLISPSTDDEFGKTFLITMPPAEEQPATKPEPEAKPKKKAAKVKAQPTERGADYVWTAGELRDFKVFYSNRRLNYIVNATTWSDATTLKGNKADFYKYLESLPADFKLDNVIVTDGEILVG